MECALEKSYVPKVGIIGKDVSDYYNEELQLG